ncbi:MAG: hypothetical protein C0446_13045 [Chitinophaga sp.]|nr:hypothetical protein [Chitinophaga sp.]
MVDHLEYKYGIGWWTKFQSQLESIDIIKKQKITIDDIKGKWYLNKWTMYLTLSFADTTVFVDNHIDSVFYSNYSLHNDTLILKDNDRTITYKNRIIAISNHTLIIKSFWNGADTLRH